MTKCKRWEYLISLSIDGELNNSDQKRLSRHLSGCADCRRIQESMQNMADVLGTWPAIADAEMVGRIKSDILKKAGKIRKRPSAVRTFMPAYVAASILVLFVAVNLWLGPFWLRPAPIRAGLLQNDRIELVFNKPMDKETLQLPEGKDANAANVANADMKTLFAGSACGTCKKEASAPLKQKQQSREYTPYSPSHALENQPGHIPYTLTWRGNTLLVLFARRLPADARFTFIIPATVKDRWGNDLGRTYLVVVDHGQVSIKKTSAR